MVASRVFTHSLVAFASLLGYTSAAAIELRRNTTSCPGYKASNVKATNGNTVSADLRLAGPACNTYGTDLDDLRLEIDYQTR